MKLPRVRLTVRRLMALVALSAALVVGGQAWARRCVFCREKAAFFAGQEAEYRASIALLPRLFAQGDTATLAEMDQLAEIRWGSSAGSVPSARKQAEYIAAMTRGYQEVIDHSIAWRRRYVRAMFLPWEATPGKPPRKPGRRWR